MAHGQNLPSMPVLVTRGRRSFHLQVRGEGAGSSVLWAEKSHPSLLGLLLLTLGFPLGQTEEAKPILEPDKEETGELGKLVWNVTFLKSGKLAGMVWFCSAHELWVTSSFKSIVFFLWKKKGHRHAGEMLSR